MAAAQPRVTEDVRRPATVVAAQLHGGGDVGAKQPRRRIVAWRWISHGAVVGGDGGGGRHGR